MGVDVAVVGGEQIERVGAGDIAHHLVEGAPEAGDLGGVVWRARTVCMGDAVDARPVEAEQRLALHRRQRLLELH